ncbi:hypothetical protein D3228_06225 [Leucobacter luti]|nr:hypothetical protein [Leucobacter luti]
MSLQLFLRAPTQRTNRHILGRSNRFGNLRECRSSFSISFRRRISRFTVRDHLLSRHRPSLRLLKVRAVLFFELIEPSRLGLHIVVVGKFAPFPVEPRRDDRVELFLSCRRRESCVVTATGGYRIYLFGHVFYSFTSLLTAASAQRAPQRA